MLSNFKFLFVFSLFFSMASFAGPACKTCSGTDSKGWTFRGKFGLSNACVCRAYAPRRSSKNVDRALNKEMLQNFSESVNVEISPIDIVSATTHAGELIEYPFGRGNSEQNFMKRDFQDFTNFNLRYSNNEVKGGEIVVLHEVEAFFKVDSIGLGSDSVDCK